ncbi:MFS transporter [Aeoliella mucimassa]|uniref:Major Facilitator Superfamily protein n=1 Tax=Aeoliella mucimassa TaxID=2527972 RepID=A0A518AWA4_9BACT|nr:MFS transporter [Aeoliella mucimassa]QDU58971.1 Major Facilitator Superfamily protein [Aeoliella mucimassa]
MIVRFCLYSVLKNLRFSDPFLAIYLIELGFSYAEIGGLLGFEKLVTALLEIPSGYMADHWGRRRILAISFFSHAVGLSILALGALSDVPALLWFFLGLGIYGVGEAFRTGSHKAIMLDYLDVAGRGSESTAVLSLTRTFSKGSSALAGVVAGGLLYLLNDYSALFWLSAVAALFGCGLVLSYPKYLEGETARQRKEPEKTIDPHEYKLGAMLRNPKMWPLLVRSVVYESQVEVLLKLFLQPFLYQGLTAAGLPIGGVDAAAKRGTGSLLVGVNELFRDSLGAVGAKNSARAERRFADRRSVLRIIYLLTTVAVAVLTLAAVDASRFSLVLVGLATVGALTFLQNLRRPIFVSELNEVANKPLRATILSIDSQARSFMVAAQLPLLGLAADHWGLWTVGAITGVLMLVGALFYSRG